LFLFDRQPLLPSDESAQKLPELFDIHVMLFADTSAATVAALQRAFSLEASAARKLVMQAPIIVKRGATPEVAAAIFDVLAPLGAQVVLLPSSGEPIVKRVDSRMDLSEPAPVADAPIVSGWGGLELELELPTPAPTPAWDELDIGTSDAPPDFHAQAADPTYSEPSPSPSPSLSLRAPSLPVPAVVSARRKAAPPAEPPANLDLGLGNVPPLPSMGTALSVRPSGKPPPVPAAALTVSGPPPRARAIDSSSLSLPELSSSVGTRRPPPRAYESDPPPSEDSLPDNSGRAAPRRSIASGGQGVHPGNPRSPQRLDLDDPRDRTDSDKPEPTRVPASPTEAGKAGPRPATNAEEPAGAALARSRVQAAAELVLAILIVFMGLRTDHSILHGNANMLWVALHGLAIFSVGRAVAGLRK